MILIIWINGAFGAGKTETAYELHRRLPDSFVYDPENVGYYIRANIPDVMTKSEINLSMLKYIANEYNGTIIVPMTIVNPDYWMDIAGNLIKEGLEVHHFTLCASRETLLKRLVGRGEGNGSWALQQIDRCITGLNKDVFKDHVDTNNLTTLEVVEMIARKLDINLTPT